MSGAPPVPTGQARKATAAPTFADPSRRLKSPPRSSAIVPFAVVACPGCQRPWSVDLRNRTVTCPRCTRKVDLRTRRRLWEGEDAVQAGAAAGRIAAALEGGDVTEAPALPRHDDALDAAAAQASRERNLSRRAEVAADWLCRLEGEATEERLMEVMRRAGIDDARAERERIRLLVQDFLFERRPGVYGAL